MYLLSSIGGIVAIPIAIAVCAIICFYKGRKNWMSGTIVTIRDINGIPIREEESEVRKSWFQIGANIFGLMLLAASIGIYIWMYLEK